MAMRFSSLVAAIAACGSLVCAFLVILLPRSQTAGIVTLKIDLAHLESSGRIYGQRSESWIRDFGQLPGAVHTVAAAATSVVGDRATGLASEAHSGIGVATAAATATADSILGGMDPGTMPQKVSIGSYQWCIGYQHRSECHRPPVQVSDVLSPPLSTFFHDHWDELQHLLNLLGKSIEGTVRYPLIVATTLVLTTIIYWLWLQISAREIPKHFHITFLTSLSLGCLACGVVPTTSIFVFQSRLHNAINKDFPPLSVEDGVDGLLSLGFLSWVMLMVVSIFASHPWKAKG